jgi:hypothetical protein
VARAEVLIFVHPADLDASAVRRFAAGGLGKESAEVKVTPHTD